MFSWKINCGKYLPERKSTLEAVKVPTKWYMSLKLGKADFFILRCLFLQSSASKLDALFGTLDISHFKVLAASNSKIINVRCNFGARRPRDVVTNVKHTNNQSELMPLSNAACPSYDKTFC